MADHVHLALRLSKTMALSKMVSELKTGSSKWLKSQEPTLANFAWQNGYGAFSVNPKDLDALITYIDQQEERHRTLSFQDEFRRFLTRYGVDIDEDKLWG